MMSEIKYWLWLTTRMELSLDGMHRTLEYFGSPEEVYYAPPEAYNALTTLRPVAKASLKDKSMDLPERILSDCDRLGVRIYTIRDSGYPERLRHIFQPPLVLYMQGKQIHFDDEAAIAMAGTRKCSEYGRRMADKLAYEITRQGGLVVTGVVPGCDYAAATAALRAGGPVACVLAGGVDVPFDQYSHKLYERVLENGTLVTEYPPGREPVGRNFPIRNRILTGLCVGTLCVEGSMTSGTMLVAKLTMDQNRDLFAVPTGADRPEGAGVLSLIKDGAIPVTSGDEVLCQYRVRYAGRVKPEQPKGEKYPKKERKSSRPAEKIEPEEKKTVDKPDGKAYIDLRDHPSEFTDDERKILICLQSGGKCVNDIIDAIGLPARQVLSTLTVLTLRGAVEERAGCYEATVRIESE